MASITQFYIEKCRTRLSAKLGKKATDYQLCKLLDISTSSMSRYVKHGIEADDDAAFKIAQYAQVPPMEIIGAIHAKKAKNEDTRAFWESAKKGALAGFSGFALASTLSSAPIPANAETSLNKFNISNNTDYILYELQAKYYTSLKPLKHIQNTNLVNKITLFLSNIIPRFFNLKGTYYGLHA